MTSLGAQDPALCGVRPVRGVHRGAVPPDDAGLRRKPRETRQGVRCSQAGTYLLYRSRLDKALLPHMN